MRINLLSFLLPFQLVSLGKYYQTKETEDFRQNKTYLLSFYWLVPKPVQELRPLFKETNFTLRATDCLSF